MDLPQKPGDLLAQPTRARLFELLRELGRPAATEELAKRLGLHPNGVRLHMERLQDAGLVERRRERIARGRPRDSWALSADAQPGGDPPSGYAALARWLVRSLTAGGARVRDLEETGRRIGRELAAADGAAADGGRARGGGGDSGVDGRSGGERDGEQQLFDVLTSLGFQPEREPQGRDAIAYRLRNCPYRDVVRERQPLVCGLHRGLTQGLLEAIEPGSRLTGFEPQDPDAAGCMVRVRGPLAQQRPEVEPAR